MATKVMQNFLYLMAKGDVDLDTDNLKWILMDTGFTLDQANHHEYADVSASELSAGNGYTQADKAATGISISRNDTLYKLTITWNNPQWTASGGSIGPSPGAFLFDDSVANDPLVMYIEFASEGTEEDGGTFTLANPTLELPTSC
jgi:hypothetical protein